MRFVGGAVVLAILSGTAWADDRQMETGGEVVPIVTHEDVLVVAAYAGETRVTDKKFWIAAGALNTAMLLDTMSTFDVRRRCPRCRETTPYVGPFVDRGPLVAFTAGLALDAGMMVLARKMKASSKPQIRKIWWLVPVALTSGHLIAYRHNRGVAR